MLLRIAFLAAFFIISFPGFTQKKSVKTETPTASTPRYDSVFKSVKWRNIGPYRGGRSNAVSGSRGNDQLFYAGYTGGGLWKTEDGGIRWTNISDGFFTR